MIKIIFDYQSELNNNLWEKRYYDDIIEELSKNEEFNIYHSKTSSDSIKHIMSGMYDILVPTGLNSYYLSVASKKLIICLHINHMNYELLSDFANKYKKEVRNIIKSRAEQVCLVNKIIFPSSFTFDNFNIFYEDFEEAIPIKEKLTIIPLGINLFNTKTSIDKPLIKELYILFANNRKDIIDVQEFKETVLIIKDLLIEYNIKVVATGVHFFPDDISFIKENKLEDIIIYYDITADIDKLNNLYKYALCTICLEQISGSTYPVLESWKHNKLTLMHSRNILYKLMAPKSPLFFNKDNIKDVLLNLIHAPLELRNNILDYQKQQLYSYDISKCCDKYKNLFLNLTKTN